MATARVSQRRKTAYAAAAAAKQKRQKIMVIGGVVLLVLILAYEIPHTLSLLKSSSTPTAVTAAPPVTSPSTNTGSALRAVRRHTPVDPFTGGAALAGEPAYGQVASPRGLRDPFGNSGAGVNAVAPVTPPTVTPQVQLLPKQIVIGSPGKGRVAVRGWILILASIPTGQGRASATTVANKARNNGLTFVSVLNSSNRRPLRGGYWVVYTGPYPSLGSVNSASTHVHASGFGDAYIRQLIVYKKK
jgi:hypothetical protein